MAFKHLKKSFGLITYLVFAYVQAETCPPESLTRPCECLPEYGLTLECRNITDASILDGISRRTGDITFDKFRVFNSSIESIPPNTLMKKQFQEIEIYDTKLRSLFDGVDESNNIRSLDLLHAEFAQKFPWAQLKPLKKLRSFRAVRGFIPELDDEFKDNVNKELFFLTLTETNTRWISEGILSDYKDLREIAINNCGLRDVKRNYFPRPAAKLSQIRLEGNVIHVLPDDIFEEMPKLEFVSLKGNRLSAIPETVFKSLDHPLSSLRLEKNPLKCDCDLKWVVSSYVQRYGVIGKCQSGLEELRDKELEELKSEDFESCH